MPASSRDIGGVIDGQTVLARGLCGLEHSLLVHPVDRRWAGKTDEFDKTPGVGRRSPTDDGYVRDLVKGKVERRKGDRLDLDYVVSGTAIIDSVGSYFRGTIISG